MVYSRDGNDTRLLMKLLKFTKKDFVYLQSTTFWSDYYRNSNYFLEKNTKILQNIRKTFKYETMEDIVMEIRQKIDKKNFHKTVIRASSFNDVIRFMVMIGIDVSILNSICFDLTKKYSIEKWMAKSIILEIEEKFWFSNFNFDRFRMIYRKESNSMEFAWPKICQYLSIGDIRELSYVSKGLYSKINKIFYQRVLLEKDDIEPGLRQRLWLGIIPDVSLTF